MNLRYLCLVYEGEAKVSALPEGAPAASAGENFDELGELQRRGYYIASARLQPAEMAATVRVRNGSVLISDGPDVGTKERLTRFYIIDARDLNDAIRMATKMPGARQGWIEVRPLEGCDPD